MKKILTVLMSLGLLVACSSNHYSSISDGDEVIFTKADGTSYSKQSLYEDMKSNDIADTLKVGLINKLAEYEGIDMEEVENEVSETVDAMVTAGYDQFIITYYGSVSNYKNSTIANQALTKLCENEVTNNFDQYVSDYEPYKAEIVYFDTKEAAQAVLDAVANEENTFEYACTENGYTSEVSETLYTDSDSDLPVDVKDYVLNTETTGLSDVIEVSTTTTDSDGNSTVTPRYYIVNLISKNAEDFKDEFISTIAEKVDQETLINSLLEKYNIEVHDQNVYEALKDTYGAVK